MFRVIDRLTINVFPSPERADWSKYVSFEFLNGMCDCLLAIAVNTSTNELNDLLIATVSLNRAPLAPDRSTRSDPARSIPNSHYISICYPTLI